MPIFEALAFVSAGLGHMQARKNARAQAEYNNKLQIQRNAHYNSLVAYQRALAAYQRRRYRAVAKSAKKDADQQYNAVFESIDQRRDQAFQTIENYSRQAAAGAATYASSADETAGQTKRLVLQEFKANEARAAAIVHDNLEGYIRQGQRRLEGIRAAAQNKINAAMPSPLQPIAPPDQLPGTYQPGGMDLAIDLMGAGMQIASYNQSIESAAQAAAGVA